MEQFCGSRFWDLDVTWFTDDPDFTPCFRSTVLVWIPAAFIWIFAAFDILNSAGLSKPRRLPTPWNLFNISKIIICILLMVTEIVNLSNSLRLEIGGFVVYAVDKYTPILKLCTYALVLGLAIFSKRNGVPGSNIQFGFWLLLLICEFFPFRSAIKENQFLDEKNEYLLLLICHIVYYPLIIGQFLLHCWADASVSSVEAYKSKENACLQNESSPLNKLFFSWFDPMVLKGYKKALEVKDLWTLNPEDKSRACVPLFDKYWSRKLAKNIEDKMSGKVKKVKTVGILPVLFQAFGTTFIAGSVVKFVPDLLAFVSPQILNLLIAFTNSDEASWKGYVYAGLMLCSGFVQALTMAHYYNSMYGVSLRVKSALVSAVYRKALLISNSTKKGSTAGEIVNLMSVDVQKVLDVIPYITMVWTSPLQIGISLYFLWGLLGPSVLAGVGVIILIIPINGVISGLVRKFQMSQMRNKDERVKLINEILGGIKILKLYAWENSFQEHVLQIRGKEAKTLKNAYYLNAVNDFLWSCSQFLITIVTFGVYILVDETHVLDAQKAFVALSLFNVMTMPLIALPMVIVWAIQAAVSLTRLNKFMNSEEIDFTAVTHNPSETHPIVIENGNFTWDREENDVLKNINLKVREGSLVGIVGVVGSGKSSLLSAILGELDRTSGRVNTKGSIGYVAQQAWIQNATLRENILFGKPYDPLKYDKVIDACSLLPDLEIFPGRDKIEIGEKGINLSGGQKQRISLARAAYNNADVYLLDDTLSAVDSHVPRHIFDKVLGPHGLLQRKTRVLVTHGITFLPQFDQIVVMKDGGISEVGTYQELLDKKGDFSDFIAQYLTTGENKVDNDVEVPDGEGPPQRTSFSGSDHEKSNEVTGVRKRKSHGSFKQSKSMTAEESLALLAQQKLIQEEISETTGVSLTVYIDYFRAMSWKRIVPAFAMYFCYQAFAVGSNLWLSVWSNEPVVNGTQGNRDLYLGVYAGFGVGQSISFLIASILIGLAALRSSNVFHMQMLSRILRAPMSFFNSTPTGRIVNRFAKDVDTLDTMLPMLIRTWLIMIMQVLGIIIIIVYTTPIFLAAAIPIGIFYYFVQKFYVPTSRQLKRLESVTRSPIYSHFSETINGAATIRAYGHQERFILESEAKVDLNQACYFPSMLSNRWLSVRMETAGTLIIFFAALFAVTNRGSLNPGLVGLSVSYALTMTFSLTYLVRSVCDVEANIVAVERLKEYAECEQEAPWKSVRRPPKTWPAYGSIQFNNYETRYRENLDLVLRQVNFQVEPGEKIGIVGRTGAGKSSMTLALFRLIEAAGGSIHVDGEDIAKVGLHDLRSRLTIIPQDPVLFSGTLKFNLDPFGKYSDSNLWRSLESAHLKNFVFDLPAQLDHPISEGGENLSVGQRQLVCLARALLRKTKILVLDEATAAVDLETDDLIQHTIRQEFKDCTVITIAHRLNTIMDSTRILVLDNGRLSEYDTPENLLKNKSSLFYSMAKDAGLT